jgi:hypothetical protein
MAQWTCHNASDESRAGFDSPAPCAMDHQPVCRIAIYHAGSVLVGATAIEYDGNSTGVVSDSDVSVSSSVDETKDAFVLLFSKSGDRLR